MANYRIVLRKSAAKEIENLQRKDKKRILDRIRALSIDPRPVGSKKLSGDDKYRIRQGDFRVLYQVRDLEVTVVVVKVGHRKDVYQ